MKRNTLARIAAITAIIAVVSLLIAMAIGFASGTFQSIVNGTFRPFEKGNTITIDERRSIPLTGIQSIRVRTVGETVLIREGSGETITTWFHGRINSTSPDDRPHLQVNRGENDVEISIERRKDSMIGRSYKNGEVKISIPKQFAGRLSVCAVSADITMENTNCNELALTTVSGDIRSGNIKAVTEAVDVNTTSGDVALGFVRMPSRIAAETVSGSIRLGLPSNASFKLDARSTSGDTTCSFPMTLVSSPGMGHGIAGTVGDGKGSIRAESVSGDIEIIRN